MDYIIFFFKAFTSDLCLDGVLCPLCTKRLLWVCLVTNWMKTINPCISLMMYFQNVIRKQLQVSSNTPGKWVEWNSCQDHPTESSWVSAGWSLCRHCCSTCSFLQVQKHAALKTVLSTPTKWLDTHSQFLWDLNPRFRVSPAHDQIWHTCGCYIPKMWIF